MASFGKLTEYFSLRKSRPELRSRRWGRRSGSCCCSVTECRYGVAATVPVPLGVPGGCGMGRGALVLAFCYPWCFAFCLPPLGLGGGWEQAKGSGSITLFLSGAPTQLIAAGWFWQALSPGICLPAQGMSQVLVAHLGCLLGEHVQLYLPASAWCSLLCPCTVPSSEERGHFTRITFPSTCPMQRPLQGQQEVASQVKWNLCV